MNRFLMAVFLVGLTGCSDSGSGGGDASKAPAVKMDRIQGKVQIQEQASSSEAALNSGGPAVFLWEGVRRYRLFFKSRTEVEPGKKYAVEGIWAQRVIDEIGDPEKGKNGYPLQASCERVVKMLWSGQAFDATDARVSALKGAIKRYPARPVFLVSKLSVVDGDAPPKKEEELPEIAMTADQAKAVLVKGTTEYPAALWAPEGGTARCKVVIGKDGLVTELNSGVQLCEAVSWSEFQYKPQTKNGKPVQVNTEVEVRFVGQK